MDSMDFDFNSDYVVDVYNDGRNAALGTQLLEVFAVKLSNKCEVYGSFYVKDGIRTLCYYNRQPEECELINEDRDWSLSLSGPHRPVTVTSHIEFLLDLKDNIGDEFMKISLSLCLMDNENEGNVDELIDSVFEKYRFVEVTWGSASATIYYTLSRLAAQANPSFKLVDESGENGHVDVYGTIVARYGNNYDTSVTDDVRQHFSFLLFKKVLQDKVQVKYGETIPLLRSQVAVPRCTSIAIELNLDFIHSNGVKEQIQNHKLYFQASEKFQYSQTLQLKHGTMVLNVYWWDVFGSKGVLGAAID